MEKIQAKIVPQLVPVLSCMDSFHTTRPATGPYTEPYGPDHTLPFPKLCFSTIPHLWLRFLYRRGTAVAQLLRCCATNRKVAGSIPAGVSGPFIDIKSLRSHYGPGVDSACKRNEYQEYFLGVKAAGA